MKDGSLTAEASEAQYQPSDEAINIYRQLFTSRCPNNGKTIYYLLVIYTTEIVMVEDIQAAVATHEEGYHESIASDLQGRLPGRQMLKAIHHGTEIVTWRGRA